MSSATPIRLEDYTPPNFLIDHVHLTFRLHEQKTRVLSKIAFRPNPNAASRHFWLDGSHLKLIRASIDGKLVEPEIQDQGLTIDVPDAPFLWEAEVEIDPSANTALEGLYLSNGLFCTQCEAEGFRRITFFPDRPDVMATFDVRIESDAPVLLSNGNPGASGPGFAEWHDPWPKPAYLFALVAGDLVATRGTFRTMEERDVDLAIWTRDADRNKADYALDALIRSMVWDEETYGRAYDLDVFNIVAVDDFNAGAMENKGLNIFNAKYVLASPETATDQDYALIEGVIAHEYFHNWTGNRITCRDWFQLCLKEGLTVFRDQQFSGDMRSTAVKRIDDVEVLRAAQFREDAGPLAHPVRPEEFVEINNFYTSTVYEKGAELIGMLKTLVGDSAYDQALKLYFDRHDGDAATIEDWLQVFEDTTGQDLSQFERWYSQAGTPKVTVRLDRDDDAWLIKASQRTDPTPGQQSKEDLVIPIRLQAFDQNGQPLLTTPDTVAVLDRPEGVLAEIPIKNAPKPPIVSALRGFSAPVTLEQDLDAKDRLFLFAHDTDPFNRWDAGRRLFKDTVLDVLLSSKRPSGALLDAADKLAGDDTLDPAFRAFALSLPSEDDLAQTLYSHGTTPDPLAVHTARKEVQRHLSDRLHGTACGLLKELADPGPFSADATAAGRRALWLKALKWVTDTEGTDRARDSFQRADNMTVSLSALALLLDAQHGAEELQYFYETWRHERLVVDKWFALQVSLAAPSQAVKVAETLTEHPDFEWTNPNRFRSVIGALVGNTAGFHAIDGSGYAFLADWLIRLDAKNPQTAARMSTAFETWHRFDPDRKALMTEALERIKRTNSLSRDTSEMVDRLLAN